MYLNAINAVNLPSVHNIGLWEDHFLGETNAKSSGKNSDKPINSNMRFINLAFLKAAFA